MTTTTIGQRFERNDDAVSHEPEVLGVPATGDGVALEFPAYAPCATGFGFEPLGVNTGFEPIGVNIGFEPLGVMIGFEPLGVVKPAGIEIGTGPLFREPPVPSTRKARSA